ncbi:MAG: uroporphyrinogen decarboxylase family protein [Lentisphaeria bacterium]|nr:uroporphyrinogen decarboxylase family protein [Lentisphaeria bacterium]
MMTHVERFNAVMNGQPVDRYPRIEWAGYWDKTLERWYDEGLPRELTDRQAIREYLGLDPYTQFWMGPRGPRTPRAPSHGAGILKTEAEYDRLLPTLYQVPDFTHERFQTAALEQAKGDRVVWISLDGFFWYPRALFGIEHHLFAFYDQPDLMKRVNRDLLAFNLKALEEFCETVCVPQFMTLAEDMSYNHGPMLSKELFDDFLAPYYQPLVTALKERGIRVFVDSDGDVEPLIPWLKEVGVEGILPLERMAGVDVADIRRHHPEWLMIGAYDKMVMKNGEAAMRAEFERLLPTLRGGGFIPSVDHQTPPDVSLENYRVYLRLLEEYTGA